MKNSNDTIGDRTRDLLACSAVPQPTAPPNLISSAPIAQTNNNTKVKDYEKIYNKISKKKQKRILNLWLLRLTKYLS